MPDAVLDFWFDFASTYSYPAALRIRPLARQAGVTVRFRPFLLGPIFKAQGWDSSPFNLYPAKGRNMWRDLERLCADLALPFRRPEPFPLSSLTAARVALVGLDAKWGQDSWGQDSWGQDSWGQDSWGQDSWGQDSWGEDFCEAVYRAQFGEGLRIDDAGTLADILAGLKVDAAPALAAAQSGDNKARLRAQTEDAQRIGVYGAPTFTTADGELFWGNDRLERALLWAKRGS